MAINRYQNREILITYKEKYDNIIKERTANNIFHYETPTFSFDESVTEYPFEFIQEVWKHGDKLYKFSNRYYGETQFWWVIGLVNQKPTDSDFKIGDSVLIPTPLSEVLEFIGFEI